MANQTLIGLTLCLCALTTAQGAQADDAFYDKDLFETFEYGFRCKQKTLGKSAAPDTAIGSIDLIDSFSGFTWSTTQVPAVLGLSFGVRTQVFDGQFINDVEVIVTHPPLLETGLTSQSWTSYLSDQSAGISTYAFDMPFELVPGDWSLEARKDDHVFYHVDFTVFDPVNAPHWRGVCATADFLS